MIKKISFVEGFGGKCNVVVGVYDTGDLSCNAKNLNEKLAGKINEIMKSNIFTGKLYESYSFPSFSDVCDNVILLGLGKYDKIFSKFELEKLGVAVYTASSAFKICTVAIDDADVKLEENAQTKSQTLIAFGSLLRSWTFDKYKTQKDEKIKLSELQYVTTDIEKSKAEFEPYAKLADAIFLTRRVVSEPANVIYPESFAKITEDELTPLGVGISILDKDEMAVLGMNALLGVAQGSEKEPKLVVLTWNGARNSESPIVVAGKGVTFDSGGISLKPSDGMEEMRCDMAGAGVVLGLMKAVAANRVPVNVIGIMALVENMPSGTAQRPGDVVKSMSGQTIEILNTDAEGRLILADALWYAQERYAPKAIIDLATLTGAIIVALGHEFAGLFSNNDGLSAAIQKSADVTGEKVWRMPMTENFDRGIDSDVADVRNTGRPNVRGSSITAAHFIGRFVNDRPWAHLDIAGVEFVSNDLFICAKGATGFGVHLMYDMLCNAKELVV